MARGRRKTKNEQKATQRSLTGRGGKQMINGAHAKRHNRARHKGPTQSGRMERGGKRAHTKRNNGAKHRKRKTKSAYATERLGDEIIKV